LAKGLIFENHNGRDYFIVAGDDKKALLRDVNHGCYVVAWNIDWVHMCWGSGSYFGADEFELAVRAFLSRTE
jgi:hypothetical protein